MPATRAATLALSPLRACCRHKWFKPPLARVINLRKDFEKNKRIPRIVNRKLQH